MKNKKVVVVGAGLGGLSCAISLATYGFQVEVFEKNDKVGGKLNVLVKDGFTFDLGPSILTLPHIFEKHFLANKKKMSDYVTIQELDPHWRNFFEDGTAIDLSPDMRKMEIELKKLGEDSFGFYQFIEYSKALYDLTAAGYFEEGLDSFSELVQHYGPIQSFKGFDVMRSMDEGVRRFIKSEKLVHILNYFVKYVGSSPYDAPALLNLIAYAQFGYGLWYVKGGMYGLAQGLEKLALELGVKFHCNQEVVEMVTDSDKLTAVKTKSGEKIACDVCVSNMEVVPAYKELLKEPQEFLKSFDKFEPACSGFVLHLGVKKIYPQLAHHNFFYSDNSKKHFQTLFHDRQLSEDPTIYLVAPCKTDPSQAPEGCEIIKILPHIPHIQDGKHFTQEEYAQYRQRILLKLERMGLTDLRKNIVTEDQWVPQDIKNKYYSHKGSIYGVVSNRWKNLGFKIPKKSSKYSNLYFVGGSVNPGGGMPMVTLSGQKAAEQIIQEYGN